MTESTFWRFPEQRPAPSSDPEAQKKQVAALIDEAEILTTRDVARITGIQARRVRAIAAELVAEGRLRGHKRGGTWIYWHPRRDV